MHGENESVDCLAGALLGSSSWPRCSGWSKAFRSPSSTGVGNKSRRAASLAQRIPPRAAMRSRSRAAVLVGRADCRVRAQDRPAKAGDRWFEGVLAAHRRAADAAGIEWKSAVYWKVREEMNGSGGLMVQRMLELGRVSGAGSIATIPSPSPAQIATWSCATRSSALRWNGRATGDRASPSNCVATDGRSQADAGKQPVVRAAGASFWSRLIPTTSARQSHDSFSPFHGFCLLTSCLIFGGKSTRFLSPLVPYTLQMCTL